MTECFFTNLENIAISNLKEARKSIRAAVAWINFRHYGDVFDELLDKNVKIKILLNNDGINQRYMEDIQYLNSRGAEIRLVNFSGIMHHKFCVIDKKLCMFGSFNWTESANVRNVEDLNLCDDYNVVAKYLLEFKALLACPGPLLLHIFRTKKVCIFQAQHRQIRSVLEPNDSGGTER